MSQDKGIHATGILFLVMVIQVVRDVAGKDCSVIVLWKKRRIL
jgi:hypothetical protein